MRIRLETLPLGVRVNLCVFLQPEDHDLLLQAGVQEWRQPSPWQARLPIELAQLILRDLEPAAFYVANCVCSRWRQAARSELLLRDLLRAARQSDRQFQTSLAGLQISSADSSRLWRHFVVAAPLRRTQSRSHPRPFRVTTLNFRPFASPPTTAGACTRIPPRIFASDYAGLLAVTAASGLHLYSIERLRIARGRGSEAKAYIATLSFPNSYTSAQLLDVCIAHQTSRAAQHFVLFAAFEPTSKHAKACVYKSDIYYTTSSSASSSRRYPFSKVTLTEMLPLADKDFGGGSSHWIDRVFRKRPTAARDVRISAIEPPHPCATAVAIVSSESTTVMLFDVNIDNKSGSGCMPYERYNAKPTSAAANKNRPGIRPVPVNPTRLLWNMSPGKHRSVQSADKSYPQDGNEDLTAVVDRESFLAWFSQLCWKPYHPILHTLDRNTHYGIEFCGGQLQVVASKLSHLGLNVEPVGITLMLPEEVDSAPCHVAALNTSQEADRDAGTGTILVAVNWKTRLFLYELQHEWLSKPEGVRSVKPRQLAHFQAAPDRQLVSSLRFYGGVSKTMRQLPCEGTAMLAVVMQAGYVHIVHFALGTQSAWQTDWSVSTSSKLKYGLGEHFGWHSHWIAEPDGNLVPAES